jgi:hypothetical protein
MRVTESRLRRIIRGVIKETHEYSGDEDEVLDPFNENNAELSKLMKIDRDTAIALLDEDIKISEKDSIINKAILDTSRIISIAEENLNQRAHTYGKELKLKLKNYLRHLANDLSVTGDDYEDDYDYDGEEEAEGPFGMTPEEREELYQSRGLSDESYR